MKRPEPQTLGNIRCLECSGAPVLQDTNLYGSSILVAVIVQSPDIMLSLDYRANVG